MAAPQAELQELIFDTITGTFQSRSGTWTGLLRDLCFCVYAVKHLCLNWPDITLAVSMAADFGSFGDTGQTLICSRTGSSAGFASFTIPDKRPIDSGQTARARQLHAQRADADVYSRGAFTRRQSWDFTLSGQAITLKVRAAAQEQFHAKWPNRAFAVAHKLIAAGSFRQAEDAARAREICFNRPGLFSRLANVSFSLGKLAGDHGSFIVSSQKPQS